MSRFLLIIASVTGIAAMDQAGCGPKQISEQSVADALRDSEEIAKHVCVQDEGERVCYTCWEIEPTACDCEPGCTDL